MRPSTPTDGLIAKAIATGLSKIEVTDKKAEEDEEAALEKEAYFEMVRKNTMRMEMLRLSRACRLKKLSSSLWSKILIRSDAGSCQSCGREPNSSKDMEVFILS